MYVHIYELPENFLKPRVSKKVSRNGTLFILLEISQKKRAGELLFDSALAFIFLVKKLDLK